MITAHDSAPEGSVLRLSSYDRHDFDRDSAILCRVTAPLVSFAFSLLHRNIACKVLGREIGQGLITLIRKLHPKNIDELILKLDMYEQKEVQRLERKEEFTAAEAVRDKVTCLRLFADKTESIAKLEQMIESLFSNDAGSLLTLSTVHKSKGLEWPKVFILDMDKYMPSKFARKPWQKIQEENLIYVALTRAQLDLRFIESSQWKDQVVRPKTNLQALTDED